MTRKLTPYDRGTRLEPRVWVRKGITGREDPRPAEDDDYGKVDFDNDESATELVAWVERGERDELTLRYYSMSDERVPAVQEYEDAPWIDEKIREAWHQGIVLEAVAALLDSRGSHAAAKLLRDTDPLDDPWGYLAAGVDDLERDYTVIAEEQS